MSTELRDALGAAGEAARADFEARDAALVIAPASKRVRRQRAAALTGGTLGVIVLATGLLWGVDTLGRDSLRSLDPASPNASAAPPNVTGVLAETPWSTLSLAAVAEPRSIGEKRADSVAGMICHHAKPQDDPRMSMMEGNPDVVPTHVTAVEDCTPVWFKDGPHTSVVDLSFTNGADSGSVNAEALVRNDSGRPLMVDTDSVFMWLETSPDGPTDTVDGVYSHTMVGGSMWGLAGDNTALLGSLADTSLVAPAESFPIAALATDGMETTGPIATMLKTGQPFRVTFWARIHEENPTGDASYLIQLGTEETFGGVDGN